MFSGTTGYHLVAVAEFRESKCAEYILTRQPRFIQFFADEIGVFHIYYNCIVKPNLPG